MLGARHAVGSGGPSCFFKRKVRIRRAVCAGEVLHARLL